jgi:hypothetical protein
MLVELLILQKGHLFYLGTHFFFLLNQLVILGLGDHGVASQQLEGDHTESPDVYLAVVFLSFFIELWGLEIARPTVKGADRLIRKGLFAEGPIDDFEGDGMIIEEMYHNIARFEISMYDANLRDLAAFMVLHDLFIFLKLRVLSYAAHYESIVFCAN